MRSVYSSTPFLSCLSLVSFFFRNYLHYWLELFLPIIENMSDGMRSPSISVIVSSCNQFIELYWLFCRRKIFSSNFVLIAFRSLCHFLLLLFDLLQFFQHCWRFLLHSIRVIVIINNYCLYRLLFVAFVLTLYSLFIDICCSSIVFFYCRLHKHYCLIVVICLFYC